MVHSGVLNLQSPGRGGLLDITSDVAGQISRSGFSEGIVTVFVSGSTAGISTIEYEPGLVSDFTTFQDQWIPESPYYRHNEGGRDDNAHSHLRATMLGPSITVPFSHHRMHLGTWQQIVLVDFDTRPRNRRVTCQVMGE